MKIPLLKLPAKKMKVLQKSELKRLQALAEINPNIDQQEIDHLRDETGDMQHFLNSTHIRLDKLRVAVVTGNKIGELSWNLSNELFILISEFTSCCSQ